MIVSQSLYCSEFVHRARCFPVGSPRTARRIGRMRAQRRKHMGSALEVGQKRRAGGRHHGDHAQKTGTPPRAGVRVEK